MTDTDTWHLSEGDLITPELTVLRRLGGGFAYEVFLAFDEVTYVPVVVKVLRPGQIHDESTLRGLRREIEALALVNHPVVARGMRFDPDCERPHVVLQHIEGPRLSSLIRRHGRLQEQQYLPLAIEVAAALHYFRGVDLLHLDVKPSNIIMSAPARLIDLSIARTPEYASRSKRLAPTTTCRPSRPIPTPTATPALPRTCGGSAPRCSTPWPGTAPSTRESSTLPIWPVASFDRDPDKRPLPSEIVDALEPVLGGLPAPKLTFKVRG